MCIFTAGTMRLREQREHIKGVLKETITLLCKSGLEYKANVSIEALIGITLDDRDVLLVNINETIRLNDDGSVVSDHEDSLLNQVTRDSSQYIDNGQYSSDSAIDEHKVDRIPDVRKRKRKRANPTKLSADFTPAKLTCANKQQQYMHDSDVNLSMLDDDSTVDSDDVSLVLVKNNTSALNTVQHNNSSLTTSSLPYQAYSGDSQSADNDDVQPNQGASIGGVAVWSTPEAAAGAGSTETVGTQFYY